MAGMDVVLATQIVAVHYVFAIVGKLASGVMLSLPHVPRVSLFVVVPLTYVASHFLLLDVHPSALLGAQSDPLVAATRSYGRLLAYAIVVGVSFGVIFGTLLCMPARLFGLGSLPVLQNVAASAVLLASAMFSPLAGFLRDVFHGYEVTLLCTFVASFAQLLLMVFLMTCDEDAEQARAKNAALEVV